MAPFLLANFLATFYFVFYLQGGLRPLYRYGTKYNVARKLAERNEAIIYAQAGTFGLGYLGSRVPVVLTRFETLRRCHQKQTHRGRVWRSTAFPGNFFEERPAKLPPLPENRTVGSLVGRGGEQSPLGKLS